MPEAKAMLPSEFAHGVKPDRLAEILRFLKGARNCLDWVEFDHHLDSDYENEEYLEDLKRRIDAVLIVGQEGGNARTHSDGEA